MNCPKCRAGKLETLKLHTKQGHDLELDQCSICGGIWFDRGEIEEYLTGTVEVIDVPLLDPAVSVELDFREATCPRCSIKLQKTHAPQNEKIQGDNCPQCGGLWLDAGEADDIAMAEKVNAAFNDWLLKIKPAAK